MSLYQQWEANATREMSQQEYNTFWQGYLAEEQGVYEKILGENNPSLKGSLKDIAASFDMDTTTFAGFLDGINTSLSQELDLNELTEETALDLTIDFEKLYWNMLDCKAEWLYTLTEWDGVLPSDKRKEIKKEYNKTKQVVKGEKIGRNDPCSCGSGKKYKKCCMNKED